MSTLNHAKQDIHQPDPRVTVTTDLLVRQRYHARQFNLTGLKKATSAISGLHDSRFRGRGMDYLESRAYHAGDDIRNMDWRVTARTGTAHTKLFQEERERPVYIVLDTNRSMRFGTRLQFKSVLAAKVAAVLGWSSILQGDRIGVMTYGCHGLRSHRALAGKRGMMNVISCAVESYAISNHDVQPLSQALEQLRHINRPGSLILIVSDLYHLGENCRKHVIQLSKHNDVLAFMVQDPFELKTPKPASYGVSDGLQNVTLDTRKKSVRKHIDGIRSDQYQNINENIIKAGVPVLSLITNQPVVMQLKHAMSKPGSMLVNESE